MKHIEGTEGETRRGKLMADIAKENNIEHLVYSSVEQAFLLQQRLAEINHPDHTLLTYPDLGHIFYPSSKWSTGMGPIEPYALADLYGWLESHSGFKHVPSVMSSSYSSSSSTNSTTE